MIPKSKESKISNSEDNSDQSSNMSASSSS